MRPARSPIQRMGGLCFVHENAFIIPAPWPRHERPGGFLRSCSAAPLWSLGVLGGEQPCGSCLRHPRASRWAVGVSPKAPTGSTPRLGSGAAHRSSLPMCPARFRPGALPPRVGRQRRLRRAAPCTHCGAASSGARPVAGTASGTPNELSATFGAAAGAYHGRGSRDHNKGEVTVGLSASGSRAGPGRPLNASGITGTPALVVTTSPHLPFRETPPPS